MTRSVVIFGVDGLDPELCEHMMKSGELPALTGLGNEGSFSRLATSYPPQSPVAWSTMATSMNPGQHGLFDFLSRDPKNYAIELAVLKINPRNFLGRGRNMFLPVRRGDGFWDRVATAELPATVLRWPITFPPTSERAKVLAGLGVPDIKGGLGRYSFYSDSEQVLGTGGKGDRHLVKFSNGIASSTIEGPRVSALSSKGNATVPLEIRLDKNQGRVFVRVDQDESTVKVGEFSQWFRPIFSVGLLSKARCLCRFYLEGIEPLRLYLTPLQVDPTEPVFPISTPDSFARDLVERTGLYHTLGMPEDTNALVEGHLSEKAFLESCDDIISEQERMLDSQLAEFDRGLLANVFFSSDRIQHIFWVTRDPHHPLYSEKYAKSYQNVIPQLYRRLDAILAKVLTQARERNAEVIVCSDHGFTTYRTNVHLNTWLIQEGLMTLKSKPASDDTEGGPLFEHVDWSKTKAYALGFNGIFLNLADREGKGIVVQGQEAFDLARKIQTGLLKIKDSQGTPVVSSAFLSSDIYHGKRMSAAPDVVLGFHPGFRCSFQTALGGTPSRGWLEPNDKKWTGDHLMDPKAVPGAFFTSFKVKSDQVSVLDIAPTVVKLLGIEPGKNWEGKALI